MLDTGSADLYGGCDWIHVHFIMSLDILLSNISINLKKVLLRIRMKNDKKLSVGFSKTMDFNFLSVVSKLKTENMLVDDLLISF